MSNIINSHISDTNNIYSGTAFAKKQQKQYINAVQNLPVYSVDMAIKERDEFRRQVTEEQAKTLNKRQKKNLKPVLIITAAVCALLLLLKNKKPVNKA